MGTRRIVCPTDFGEGDERALAAALRLAAGGPAEIILLHVVEDPAESVYGERSEEGKDRAAWGLWKVAQKEIEERLTALVPRSLPDGVSVRTACAFGNPAERIAETVEQEGADLVVLCGRRRKTLLQGMHLGEVAYRVVRTVGCDVLVVR